MKKGISFFFVFVQLIAFGQQKAPIDFGYKQIDFVYNEDHVDILIKSKIGEENQKKPIFLFCQGSLPQPLIKTDGDRVYGVFPFNPDSLIENYHLVIIGKPHIPIIADIKTLGAHFTCVDSLSRFPKAYSDRNLLTYYVKRNIEIIKFLQLQNWVSHDQLVLAGHSEGSTVAAKIASVFPKVTHLIYSGGNPMGRIMAMIQQSRANETDTDSTRFGEEEFDYWSKVVANKSSLDDSQGDTPQAAYEFSNPPMDYLKQLTIPVLVCYGTKDWSAPFNDYLRVEMIKEGKKNFTFKAYIGTEHNYFPLSAENKPNYDVFNWDNVVLDWQKWLINN